MFRTHSYNAHIVHRAVKTCGLFLDHPEYDYKTTTHLWNITVEVAVCFIDPLVESWRLSGRFSLILLTLFP